MKTGILIATAATAALMAFGAQAAPTTVYNTELGPLTGTGVTTTSATGTQSTNPANNLSSEAPAADEWQQRNVRGNGEVGITTDYADANGGNGSIYFSTDGSNPSKADMEYYFSQPLALSTFESATYDWYRDSASTNGAVQGPSLRLAVSTGAPGSFTYLVFEPYYQGPPAPLVTDTWVTSVFNTGSTVWASNAGLTLPPATGSCAVGCFNTLANWASANPTLNVIGVSTGVGSGWTAGGFRGAVDNVGFTFDGESSSFNFEVSAVPEPATWAMMIAGFGLAGAALRRRSKAAVAT